MGKFRGLDVAVYAAYKHEPSVEPIARTDYRRT